MNIEVVNAHGSARIALLGANVMHYQPAGGEPLLWLSPKSRFVEGTAIRGGIPICWPWFAKAHPDKPSHGVARTRLWTHVKTTESAEGTEVVLELRDDATSRALWPHAFRLELRVSVGVALGLTLVHQNLGDQTVECTGALHAYLAVSDIDAVHVEGLGKTPYFDKIAGLETRQPGAVTVSGPIDRVYRNTEDAVTLVDGGSRVRMSKFGSRSTVVWNPWTGAADMADVPDDGYREFICIEAANAGDDIVSIAPGGEHRLGAIWSGA